VVVSDKEGLEGRTCGSLIGAEFVLAGGMPTDGNVGRNVHCMDMRRDLKVVSSHTLISDASSSKKVCTVADMALNHDRNTIVAACTDGTIRLLDGERRMVEVAKAKAQRGGVAKVAVFDVRTLFASEYFFVVFILHLACTCMLVSESYLRHRILVDGCCISISSSTISLSITRSNL
jgi:hypothetical protein